MEIPNHKTLGYKVCNLPFYLWWIRGRGMPRDMPLVKLIIL